MHNVQGPQAMVTQPEEFLTVDQASLIMVVDERLIHELSVLLITINSSYNISIGRFKVCSLERSTLSQRTLGTIYKLLIHGRQVIESVFILVG